MVDRNQDNTHCIFTKHFRTVNAASKPQLRLELLALRYALGCITAYCLSRLNAPS